MAYETIIVTRDGAVALNIQLIRELNSALAELDADDTVAAIVITGNEKAFAAGADIKEMQDLSYTDASMSGHFDGWDDAAKCRKPVIAAVAGFALGGGCEVAMMCDFIIAADTARFGQPEIKLGTLPGIGGTQRLTRAVGKAKAMEMCLTGRMMNAEEAERAGLVSRVVAADKLIEEAMAAAQAIAGLSRAAVRMAKESVNRAHESTLSEGLRFERNMFFSSFALEDQKEGMRAFVEKRAANWKHR
jgi:enoyl-CoA hydratase